jgi:hypothetical protein
MAKWKWSNFEKLKNSILNYLIEEKAQELLDKYHLEQQEILRKNAEEVKKTLLKKAKFLKRPKIGKGHRLGDGNGGFNYNLSRSLLNEKLRFLRGLGPPNKQVPLGKADLIQSYLVLRGGFFSPTKQNFLLIFVILSVFISYLILKPKPEDKNK